VTAITSAEAVVSAWSHGLELKHGFAAVLEVSHHSFLQRPDSFLLVRRTKARTRERGTDHADFGQLISAWRIAASEEGVPAMFDSVVSLDLINGFATNRTKPNMNPPMAVPYITEADT
jgi:hypothetical protein